MAGGTIVKYRKEGISIGNSSVNVVANSSLLTIPSLKLSGTTVSIINTVANSTVLGAASNSELTSTWAAKTYIDAHSGGGGSSNALFNTSMSAVPTQSGTGLNAWINQPASATVADTVTGISVYQPQAGANHTLAALKKDISGVSTPYSFTALITNNGRCAAYHGPVFGFSDGTKWVVCMAEFSGFLGVSWGNALSAAALTWLLQESDGNFTHGMFWFKVYNDGTSLYYYTSRDGVDWRLFYSHLVGSILANRNWLIFGNDNYNVESTSKLLSFTQGVS